MAGEDAFLYLVIAAMLGVLFALVLSIRRLMQLELKQEKLLNTIKRIELRDISMEERTYQILEKMSKQSSRSAPKKKTTTRKKKK